ncbi:AI-2E family transporter [Devosia insulae]|uniref:AI-2E family transporter n=1 Tax=Devosia insulae TaxID=408174 RepID=UPI00159F1085|nr:AI-2E family transporter [Devosia insulae]
MRKPAASRPRQGLIKDIQRTNFERVLGNAAQFAIVTIGIVVAFVAVREAQVVLAPLFLAITVGLMFGPVADMLEQRGLPEALSAGLVVLLLLFVIIVGGALFYGPLSEWAERIPVVWDRIQAELANWQEPIAAIGALQEQVKSVLGGGATMEVRVEDGSTVTGIAMLAPAILAQVGVFLVSLYFFLATRDNIRVATLSLCVSRRMRWRTAHVFRDVEQKVSKYLLTISSVNLGVGAVVTLMTWAVGLPSPLLWGAMAAVLNYIPFIGQAFMALVLFLVGLGTTGELFGGLLPMALYFGINFIEGNFVTPNLLGRTMTINPFMIFLSLTFWIWAWGPVGGLIAVPSLLVLYSIVTHILPTRTVAPRKLRRLVTQKASRDTDAAEPKVAPPEPAKPPRRKQERAPKPASAA